MRITARALVSAAGVSLADAVHCAWAGERALASREGRPFAAIPLAGEWAHRLHRALDLLAQALPAPADALLNIGSSSWQIGGAERAERVGVLAESPPTFAAGIAHRLGISAAPRCFSVACVSGLAALDAAQVELATGRARQVRVIGLELDNAFTRQGFAAMQLLSSTPCKPFDRQRDGLMLGEAIGVLDCDAGEGAGWHLSGSGSALDRSGPTSADASGEPVAAAIRLALRRAGRAPADIGVVKLHGAGSPMTEPAEAAGLRAVFGEVPPCVSLKGLIGHTLGASGPAEIALLTACLDQGWVPATMGFDAADPALGIAPSTTARRWDGRPALVLAMGFGGQVWAGVLEHRV
ncbi:beta-ketoacyl synthase N-terminal-like domain-containing protein [Niveibacterium sp. COAC-50]|uniref:beta-ketoacyl synthase N-terminal-like domain-containing protein n=1 Tax=Niveibacterium sp. COAC-50 TaxID=2729384 RepID=UPI00155678AB|nr:beta-ketoacyl synthase N-terminal-like domain-containing protein [Niveibacterium sp. COAC-50]